MALKRKITKEEFEALDPLLQAEYKQAGEEYTIDLIGGFKTDEDVSRLQDAIKKEREETKRVKEKWAALAEKDPAEIVAILDKLPELEAAASGTKIDEAKLEQLVEGRLKTKLTPLERDKAKLATDLAEAMAKVTMFEGKEKQRRMSDAIRKAAESAKIRPHAVEDAIFAAERMLEEDEFGSVVTRDGVGVTPGVSPEVWFQEMQSKRPHWWETSQGGGATGSSSGGGVVKNPWKKDSFSLTEQARITRENPSLAEQMKKSAAA